MGRLLIWISGASPEILKGFPGDRAKYIGIGAAVLITSGVAALSMTFALATALKSPLWAAIPFALAWGLAILSLDRWLVVSMQRQSNPWAYLKLAIPRLLLGLLFGFIISTPFVLQIFRPEIEQQITVIQNQRANVYFANLKTDPLSRKITADRATVNGLNNTLATNGGAGVDPGKSPTVQSLDHQRDRATSLANKYFRKWKCELDGIPPGACHPGDGPLAKADHQSYLAQKAQARKDNSQAASVRQQILRSNRIGRGKSVKAATASLPAARRQLQADVSEQNNLTDAFKSKNASNAGLLLRLQALGNVTAGNTTLSIARWLLFALFTTIECLPIMVKVLLNLGPENAYEKALAFDEKTRLRVAREEALQRQTARILEADSAMAEERRMIEERDAAMPGIVKAAIAAEERVAMKSVQAWETGQAGNGRNGSHQYSQAGPEPPPPW